MAEKADCKFQQCVLLHDVIHRCTKHIILKETQFAQFQNFFVDLAYGTHTQVLSPLKNLIV